MSPGRTILSASSPARLRPAAPPCAPTRLARDMSAFWIRQVNLQGISLFVPWKSRPGGFAHHRADGDLRPNLRFENRRWGFFVLLSRKTEEPPPFSKNFKFSKNHPIFEKPPHLRRTPPSSSIFGPEERRNSHFQSSIFGPEDRRNPAHLRSSAPEICLKIGRRTGGEGGDFFDFFEERGVFEDRGVIRSPAPKNEEPLALISDLRIPKNEKPFIHMVGRGKESPTLFASLLTPYQMSTSPPSPPEVSIFSPIFHLEDRSEDRDRPSAHFSWL